MMNNVVVVCDLPDRCLENKVFTDEFQSGYQWGDGFWVVLKQKCDYVGFEIVTSDIFLKQFDTKYCNYKSYLISSMTNNSTDLLLSKVSVPLLIYSLESPNVAVRFYADIDSIGSKYKYSFFFGGIANHLATPNLHKSLNWPNTIKSVIGSEIWKERDFLCFVASNKGKYDVLPGKPFKWLRVILKRLYLWILPFTFPFLRSVDLYDFRYKAINYFIDEKKLKLYGKDWDKKKSLSTNLFDKIRATNPQSIDDKITILGHYRFSLCFENCIYRGYITEKIFDCFFAGTIPIYLGAPDIQEHIPQSCFIDFRDFDGFEHVDTYISGLSMQDAQQYLDAAQSFLASSQFDKYTDVHFADSIFKLVEENVHDAHAMRK